METASVSNFSGNSNSYLANNTRQTNNQGKNVSSVTQLQQISQQDVTPVAIPEFNLNFANSSKGNSPDKYIWHWLLGSILALGSIAGLYAFRAREGKIENNKITQSHLSSPEDITITLSPAAQKKLQTQLETQIKDLSEALIHLSHLHSINLAPKTSTEDKKRLSLEASFPLNNPLNITTFKNLGFRIQEVEQTTGKSKPETITLISPNPERLHEHLAHIFAFRASANVLKEYMLAISRKLNYKEDITLSFAECAPGKILPKYLKGLPTMESIPLDPNNPEQLALNYNRFESAHMFHQELFKKA